MGEEFRVGRVTNADGPNALAALSRDSVLITRDSVWQWKQEGRVFHAQQGNAATKVDFAETAYDENQPQFALRIPDNIVIVPIVLAITLEDLVGTENHIVWSTTTNDIGDGASTGLTVSNMRAGLSNNDTNKVTARSLYTGDAVTATGLIEIKRWHRSFASAAVTDGHLPEDYLGDILKDSWMPILGDGATLQLHIFATGTAPQGFGEYIWAEFAKGELI